MFSSYRLNSLAYSALQSCYGFNADMVHTMTKAQILALLQSAGGGTGAEVVARYFDCLVDTGDHGMRGRFGGHDWDVRSMLSRFQELTWVDLDQIPTERQQLFRGMLHQSGIFQMDLGPDRLVLAHFERLKPESSLTLDCLWLDHTILSRHGHSVSYLERPEVFLDAAVSLETADGQEDIVRDFCWRVFEGRLQVDLDELRWIEFSQVPLAPVSDYGATLKALFLEGAQKKLLLQHFFSVVEEEGCFTEESIEDSKERLTGREHQLVFMVWDEEYPAWELSDEMVLLKSTTWEE